MTIIILFFLPPGEIIVARASGVHLLLGLQEKTTLSISGTLICTNYRVTYIPDDQAKEKVF